MVESSRGSLPPNPKEKAPLEIGNSNIAQVLENTIIKPTKRVSGPITD